jgi:hypothetical protein
MQIRMRSWEDVMEVIDINGDGFISLEELERWGIGNIFNS